VAIRDNANCVVLPSSAAAKVEQERGYPDIVAEQCWPEWQTARGVVSKDALTVAFDEQSWTLII